MLTDTIVQKSYKKLCIEVSLTSITFCIFDTLKNQVAFLKETTFEALHPKDAIEDIFGAFFSTTPELQQDFDDVLVLHSNSLSTLVPTALFDEKVMGSYLQYNTKVFESDFFAFDSLSNYQINTVYIPYINMNNFFIDQFGTFEYKHASTILLQSVMDNSKNIENKKMLVHFRKISFEIVVVQNQQLHFFNSFEFKTPEDFIYYILFTAEQLNLNPEFFELELLGDIAINSDYFEIAYKFIRNVSLYNVGKIAANSSFSDTEIRKHFILFNS